jgi:hypothetical protein
VKDIYLNRELKEKYSRDFISNVITFDSLEAWKLDEGLHDILREINENEHISTIYSKRCYVAIPDCQPLSYLEFCYSQNIELKLFRELIPSMFYQMDPLDGTRFYYDFNFPRNNPNFSEAREKTGLGCLDDEDYFRINTIRLSLESSLPEAHFHFWEAIKKDLAVIMPDSPE